MPTAFDFSFLNETLDNVLLDLNAGLDAIDNDPNCTKCKKGAKLTERVKTAGKVMEIF